MGALSVATRSRAPDKGMSPFVQVRYGPAVSIHRHWQKVYRRNEGKFHPARCRQREDTARSRAELLTHDFGAVQFVDDAVLHHELHILKQLDVLDRIAGDGDEIRDLSFFNRAEIFLLTQQLRA